MASFAPSAPRKNRMTSIPKREFPTIAPEDWDTFARACIATDDEAFCMLCDIKRKLGGPWAAVAQFMGCSEHAIRQWGAKGKMLPSARKLIFLSWVLICRPGSCQTFLDVVCWGRTTKRGNPETAGKGFTRHPKSSALHVPQPGEGDEYNR